MMFDNIERKRLHDHINSRAMLIMDGRSDEVLERQLSALSLALIAERLESCSEMHAFKTVNDLV